MVLVWGEGGGGERGRGSGRDWETRLGDETGRLGFQPDSSLGDGRRGKGDGE